MAMIEINLNPSRRELLVFGVLLVTFTGLLGLLAHFQWDFPTAARWIWLGGGSLALLHFTIPSLRRVFYLGWMYAAFPIGWTVSHVVLGIVYFGVVTPIGLILQLFGYDSMSRRARSNQTSYWEVSSSPEDPKRYFRQF
jgi:hypothetical protein